MQKQKLYHQNHFKYSSDKSIRSSVLLKAKYWKHSNFRKDFFLSQCPQQINRSIVPVVSQGHSQNPGEIQDKWKLRLSFAK